MRLRRVTLHDIPKDQEARVLSGCPVYRVYVTRPDGSKVVDYWRNRVKRSWAVFGWMIDYRESARD